MRLFEVADRGPLMGILMNLKGQADNPRRGQQTSLTMSFSALKRLTGMEEYGLSDIEAFKSWVERSPENKKIISFIGIGKDPQITINTEKPGDNPDQPDQPKKSPSIDTMASRAAKKEISQS